MDGMVLAQVSEEGSGGCHTLLFLRNKRCLAITRGMVRYARDPAALADPLGNGVRGVIEIPAGMAPEWLADSGYIAERAGGAVILNGGSTLLLKPFSIELYASPGDALHGRDCRGAIDLEA